MRNKYQGTLAVGFVALFCLATACGDDSGGTPSDNEAGKSGAGPGSGGGGNGSAGKSSAGSVGTPSAGNGGMSGNGGEPMADAGEPSVNGGHASGEGGAPSANGGEPSGGNASGSGGEPSGDGGAAAGAAGAGGTSDGGPRDCTPITLNAFGAPQIEPEFAVYVTSFTPNIVGAAADNFRLAIQASPYDGDRTGTFDLTQNGDDNYETCARCILVYADAGQKIFYASAGTLEIADGSKQLGGTMDATITNLKLVEVTIGENAVSTPVANGACLTLASATIQVEAPPCDGFECNNGYCLASSDSECDLTVDCVDESDEFPVNASCEPVWLCDSDWYGDGDCDCGCGIKDLDCTGTTNAAECEYCVSCQGNANACDDDKVDPANTAMCQ